MTPHATTERSSTHHGARGSEKTAEQIAAAAEESNGYLKTIAGKVGQTAVMGAQVWQDFQ
jgi:hypothetical protein